MLNSSRSSWASSKRPWTRRWRESSLDWLSNFFHNLAAESTVPVLTAFFLGVMAAIGPCTMATNFAAIAYIGRKVSDRKFAILASLLYSLGRMVSYSIIGVLIIGIGLEVPGVNAFLEDVGTYVLGPLMIIAGVLMLLADRISFGGGGGRLTALGSKVSNWGLWGAFLMGVIFALAFCPYSAVLFFVTMIPMAMASTGGITFRPFSLSAPACRSSFSASSFRPAWPRRPGGLPA